VVVLLVSPNDQPDEVVYAMVKERDAVAGYGGLDCRC